MIYLDNNASTKPDSVMLEQAFAVAERCYTNPSSPYQSADAAKEVLAYAREQVAGSLGCKPTEIVFTSGGTEANGIALRTEAELGEVIIAGATEHSSVTRCATKRVKVLEDGLLDLDDLERVLSEFQTWSQVRVAVMFANNETGVIPDPQRAVPEICKKYNASLHVDAVQGYGKSDALKNVYDLQAATVSISAHKVHGLKGVGALFVREGHRVPPALCGGIHEFGVRPGTENQVGIYSLGYIAEKILTEEYQLALSKVKSKRDRLEDLLSDISEINGNPDSRIDNTSNLYFPDIPDNDIFIEELHNSGLCVSGKSACASGLPMPSSVLRAMYGNSSKRPDKSIRISLSTYTTDDEIEQAAEIIREVANGLCGV